MKTAEMYHTIQRYQKFTNRTWQIKCNQGYVTGYKSRLTVVSREAKKGQSELPKTECVTNYCVFYTSECFHDMMS